MDGTIISIREREVKVVMKIKRKCAVKKKGALKEGVGCHRGSEGQVKERGGIRKYMPRGYIILGRSRSLISQSERGEEGQGGKELEGREVLEKVIIVLH